MTYRKEESIMSRTDYTSLVTGASRIVVKIGTNALMGFSATQNTQSSPTQKSPSVQPHIDVSLISSLATQIHLLREKHKKQFVLVSSGAIGLGAAELGIATPVRGISLRQACASAGQPVLMETYRRIFKKKGIATAQILLTRDTINSRKSFENLRKSMETLLHLGVLPILNENDCVSAEEIGSAFGDNDVLSALSASKLNADLLIMLTDVEGVYSQPPQKRSANPHIRIPVIGKVTPQLRKLAGGKGTTVGTGGLLTKLDASTIAQEAGATVLIASAKIKNVVVRIMKGEDIGTLFLPGTRMSLRMRWIKYATAQGKIYIDKGACEAIIKKKSLLSVGVQRVEGDFQSHSIVQINDIAKAYSTISSIDLRAYIADTHTGRGKIVARPEDIVFT